jgi:hypothetical protein
VWIYATFGASDFRRIEDKFTRARPAVTWTWATAQKAHEHAPDAYVIGWQPLVENQFRFIEQLDSEDGTAVGTLMRGVQETLAT